MLGKQKCKILKEIRQRIADENDIPYVTHECSYQGACRGTCPRCESELRYLEQQLALRASPGKRVTVAALCAGMALTAVGCTPSEQMPNVEENNGISDQVTVGAPTLNPEDLELEGEVPCVDPESEFTPEPKEQELMGDIMILPPEKVDNG